MAPLTRSRKKALAARGAPVIDPADRLSNLPDEIQAQILSFLPAQDAVRTCVLARTWREVWKLTRRLLITGDERVLVKDVRGFVDGLLRLRLDGLKDDRPIDACEISFDWSYDENVDITRAIGRWILGVLKCQVKSLRVDISGDDDFSETGAIPLRDIPLVSQHLTRLELSGIWFFAGSGRLHAFLDFSECPVLEHLEITDCDLEYVIEMTSPSVTRLVITDCYCVYDSLRICFPLVVSLQLQNMNDQNLMLEDMPELEVAYLSFGNYDGAYDGLHVTECLVLEGLAKAKHLELLSPDNMINFTRNLRFCPTFSNLKTLVLNHYWCQSEDCSDLACMLQHVPVLEKLTVVFSHTVESEYDMVVEGHPDPTGNSAMISHHLKIVEVKCFVVDQDVVSVLNFLGKLNIRFENRV